MELFKKGNGLFGFGCMRLPMSGEEVDYSVFSQMVDAFLQAGFRYFDTAHGYLKGQSEIALKKCLTDRYPRDAYELTNKLSAFHFETEEEIRPLFESQLKACGVDYFDLYLMHAQNAVNFEKYKKCRAYETALELKKEGRIRHFGLSFHDKAEVLEQILTEYPQVEAVQIQFNYLDYNDPSVQAKQVYEVCRKFQKPIIVMEPVRGGFLANLPEKERSVLEQLGDASPASYALRYAAGFEGVEMVLSGMGNMDMIRDNVSFMKDFVPLNQEEQDAIAQVCKMLRTKKTISCTDCKYCTELCPKKIPIPALFACKNNQAILPGWTGTHYYKIHTRGRGKASDCIQCGKCESVCPQKLPIPSLLQSLKREFEE